MTRCEEVIETYAGGIQLLYAVREHLEKKATSCGFSEQIGEELAELDRVCERLRQSLRRCR